MFVYYNDTGEIQSIGPLLDSEMNHLKHAQFPLSEVAPFLHGAKAMHTHVVIPDKDNLAKLVIASKAVEVNEIKTIDRFLTEVNNTDWHNWHVGVTHDVLSSCVTFKIRESIRKELLLDTNVTSENITVHGLPFIDFYFTLNGDPNFLIHEISVPTNKLITQDEFRIYYDPKKVNIAGTSLFTKKVFANYVYVEIKPTK